MCSDNLSPDKLIVFEDLYKKYNTRLVNYAFSIIKDLPPAEDVVQDTFITFIQEDVPLNNDQARCWLYRTVLYKSLNYIKKNEIFQNIEDNQAPTQSAEEAFFDNLKKQENAKAIDEILKTFSEENKELFKIYFIEKVSHQEISKKLNISIDASKAKKMRLKQKFIKTLKAMGTDIFSQKKEKEDDENGKKN
jgi:RNA polymerase sigma-70 factor (ECF subfamily)